MSEPAPHDDRLTAFEAQLSALVPSARLNRDRLMFEAGRRAGRRRLRFTQTLLGAASVTCGMLLALLVVLPRGPQPPLAEKTVNQPSVARVDADEPADAVSLPDPDAPTNYRLLRRLSANLDAQVAYHGEPVPAVEPDRKPAPRQDSRTLLKRYLENGGPL